MDLDFPTSGVAVAKALPSLDRVRAGLQPPPRRRTPMWVLLLAASVAAFAGVSAAAVMILGPSGGPAASRSIPLTPN